MRARMSPQEVRSECHLRQSRLARLVTRSANVCSRMDLPVSRKRADADQIRGGAPLLVSRLTQIRGGAQLLVTRLTQIRGGAPLLVSRLTQIRGGAPLLVSRLTTL